MSILIGVGHKRGKPLIVISITDEMSAWDLALAFGRQDGFHRDMADAIIEAWPDDQDAT